MKYAIARILHWLIIASMVLAGIYLLLLLITFVADL